MSNDPLLQPYKLKHLTLRNRIMTTSLEPAYPEDGMPKDRYRLYHLERAKAGVAMVKPAPGRSPSASIRASVTGPMLPSAVLSKVEQYLK
jgi:2,4-dienoyl-CoA reductase-like NADH-dependent reductase (Old Yellow Enzyme family)